MELPLVTTPPRIVPAPDDQVSLVSDLENSDLNFEMSDFAARRTAAYTKLSDATNQAEKDAAIAELGIIQDEEIAAATQQKEQEKQRELAELQSRLTAEQRARNDAQAELFRERTRNRPVQDDFARRRTFFDASRITGDGGGRVSLGPQVAPPAPAAAPAPAANTGGGDNAAEQRTLDERLAQDPELAVYQELERENSTSFLNAVDAQSVVMNQRPGLFKEPTPDHLYNLVHNITTAPTDITVREDIRQEKNMMQKSMQGYLRFSGVPGKESTWETFEMQMKGLVNQAVFKERELAVLLWGLLDKDVQMYLMSKNIFQGHSYMDMFKCLQKAYKRKPAAVLMDMAQCTQGPSESVLTYTARYRIISASTYPEPPATYRVVAEQLVRNPLTQAETLQYKSLWAAAALQAQHHYVQGMRQDIRRRMRKLRFNTMEEAEAEAIEAEESLQDLGDLRENPNPLVKPQINMLRAEKGQKGYQSQGQGQIKKFDGECYACHKHGHLARECRTKPNNKWKRGNSNRSQQDENAHVQGAINAVKGQLNRSLSRESRQSHRGRSVSPRGKSPRRSGSGSSARGQGRRGRDNSRNRDRVSFSQHSSGGKYKQRAKFNALHGATHEEEEYDSSGNE